MAKPPEKRDNAAVLLRCWGVRGSIPTPGVETSRYGGNTSCIELRYGRSRIIFDAGTGLRLLGDSMGEEGEDHGEEHIFLTHFHWDHIQGFPFFGPLYDPGIHLKIVGPEQADVDIQTLFARQMGPVHFPVPFEAVEANISFAHLNEGAWRGDGFQVSALRVRHPSYTVGYRIELGGRVVCYVPDNELKAGDYPLEAAFGRSRMRDFVAGADVLIHDAMYVEEEYGERHGWGHSTFEQALALAEEGQVNRLLFFHHAPSRSDDELDRIVERFQERSVHSGGPRVGAAREGVDLVIGEE